MAGFIGGLFRIGSTVAPRVGMVARVAQFVNNPIVKVATRVTFMAGELGMMAFSIIYMKRSQEELDEVKRSYYTLAQEYGIQQRELEIAKNKLKNREIEEIKRSTRAIPETINPESKNMNQLKWLEANNKEVISEIVAPRFKQFGNLFKNFYHFGQIRDLREMLTETEFNIILSHPNDPLVITLANRQINKAEDWVKDKNKDKVIHSFEKLVFYVENGFVFREPII
jgi:hypothetical protein